MSSRIDRCFLWLMFAVLLCSCGSCSESVNVGEVAQQQDGTAVSVDEALGRAPSQQSSAPADPQGPEGPEPRTAGEYIDLSLQHYNQGEWGKCIDACVKALNLDPSSAPAYNNICAAHLQLQDYDRAILACEKALALDPDHQLARNNLNAAKRGKASIAP